jgi:probable F420-dependent oxidoreductase
MAERLRFIAPMPRLTGDGEAWVSDLHRLEDAGFDTICISEHFTRGWQISALAAMAFAAASTSRIRVQSLVLQNDMHHPALLAKQIATIDVLSGGRVELGIGAGWNRDDYLATGLPFDDGRTRVARLAEALQIIRAYFTGDSVHFAGDHYQINHMEALPRCSQRPNPPILVGAGGPRMLELAGRMADIVGIHAATSRGQIDATAVRELTAASIQEKISRVRSASASAGRPCPTIQFRSYHVRVTDALGGAEGPRSSWYAEIESAQDLLKGSPAVLVGSAAQCADTLLEWRARFGITYWHLGQDALPATRIIEEVRARE